MSDGSDTEVRSTGGLSKSVCFKEIGTNSPDFKPKSIILLYSYKSCIPSTISALARILPGNFFPLRDAVNCSKSVDEIAKKCVPTGLKYKIVDASEISSDRTFRNAWEINESELTDGVGN